SEMLDIIQRSLLEKALAFREEHTKYPETYDQFKAAVEEGFAMSWWCGARECEDAIKADTKATNRCIPLEQPGGTGKCIYCGKESKEQAIFSRAY
ncbi:MAG: hypothetical protein QUS09_05435, partial [Methanotrichaceae archaeon]|nr:hypothetical protein [Methanotrichaceae archaeon]